MDISELSYYYFLYGGLLLTRWLWIISLYHKCNFVLLSSLMAYHQIFNINNTTGATSWAGIAYTSGAPEFTPFLWSLWFPVFCMMFYVPLFSPFSFGHCFICPSSSYCFWLSLRYLFVDDCLGFFVLFLLTILCYLYFNLRLPILSFGIF
jgi:hypothetical protein